MTFKNQSYLVLILLIFITISCKKEVYKENKTTSETKKPNIVLIYTDDLGYGDLSAYGATEIKTPAIDKLAKEGILFKNAHATAATCTPSRYSLLTGNYAWRKKGTGIAKGDEALLIDTNRSTLPKTLQSAGYKTAIVGKWHLGLGDEKE